jgi:4-hydroxybenzoate polyprenyltransferase
MRNKYLTYLNERFPLQSHIPIIAIFSFSAICYALSADGATQFVSAAHYLAAFLLTATTFFLLRISDEFKDHEDDMLYRKYLPVPRGLITLRELKHIAWGVLLFQAILLFFFPQFLITYLVSIGYMTLMYHEFFVAEWLKKHQIAYVLSHMAIIPLVDLVASAAYWATDGGYPPKALVWFFLVSFFNGMVLEFGRKIKSPEMEEEGVVSYTKLYGLKGGVFLWLAVLTVTLISAFVAAKQINSPSWVYICFLSLYGVALVVALAFLQKPGKKRSKAIEIVSGVWTLGMYLNIGALPFILQ